MAHLLECAFFVLFVNDYNAYKHFGLLYQWGRKEPFTGAGPQYTNTLGSDVNSIPTAIFNNSGTWIQTPSEIANTLPKSTTIGGYIYQSPAAPSTHTLLLNPTTYYSSGDPDWSVISDNPNTWIPYSSGITKTIYDPCPYGYRVPIDGSWSDNFPSKTWTVFAVTGGTSWKSSWWPAAGERSLSTALFYSIGSGGLYWSSSRYSTASSAYFLDFSYGGGVNPSSTTYRSRGYSVRCIEERKIRIPKKKRVERLIEYRNCANEVRNIPPPPPAWDVNLASSDIRPRRRWVVAKINFLPGCNN